VNASTFPRGAALLVLVLGGCATTETVPVGPAPPEPAGWVMSSGKQPTKAEFTALAATCEERGGAVEPCFTKLGLKRAP
jgi:hypothetical protein